MFPPLKISNLKIQRYAKLDGALLISISFVLAYRISTRTFRGNFNFVLKFFSRSFQTYWLSSQFVAEIVKESDVTVKLT